MCSLNPHVDRLALAVCLEIASVVRQAIDSTKWLSRNDTYKQVQDTLDAVEADKPAALKDVIVESGHFNTTAVAENVADLFSLYRVRCAARDDRGALDFDSVEPKFSFDEKGRSVRRPITLRRTTD